MADDASEGLHSAARTPRPVVCRACTARCAQEGVCKLRLVQGQPWVHRLCWFGRLCFCGSLNATPPQKNLRARGQGVATHIRLRRSFLFSIFCRVHKRGGSLSFCKNGRESTTLPDAGFTTDPVPNPWKFFTSTVDQSLRKK